jgi:hypothetical protein
VLKVLEKEKILMPIKSGKQYRFMQMIAHNKEKVKKNSIGPSKEVAKEMIDKTPAKKRSLFMTKKNQKDKK